MKYKHIDTSNVDAKVIQSIFSSAIAPRPIAFASTIDSQGNANLSPFSYFNAFGANPPILIFSPARRGRDNTTKHTFDNINEVPEVVINVVDFSMVEQMNLSSGEYAKGVDEFAKAGFTTIASETIRPFRVKESPVQFECVVKQVIETGTQGGAGNLVICHVTRIHIKESVLDMQGNIDSSLIDLVGRMGGEEYVRTNQALFTLPKPTHALGIGIDSLPSFITDSDLFTGRQLARLGSVDRLPNQVDVELFTKVNGKIMEISRINLVKIYIEMNRPWDALCLLLSKKD
jgi:flavin reductase (DIM6/NTAB) family NADH-FMN oxidoreductase RutF